MLARDLVTVFALGLSVEGLALCPFVSMGLAMVDRADGLRFLGGRLLGIVVFGVLVSWIGSYVHVDSRYVNLAFGVGVLGVGASRLFGRAPHRPPRSTPSETCVSGRGHRNCRKARHGFSLGFLRGLLNPGRKFVYLAPLVVGAGISQGIMTSLVFGMSSSVYLLVGIFAAGILSKLTMARRYLERIGGVVLIVVGIVFSSRAILQLNVSPRAGHHFVSDRSESLCTRGTYEQALARRSS